MSENHAIVFGASGLIGWAMVDQLLAPYPAPGTFASITAVANRPIDLGEAHWPEPEAGRRPDLRLVSGVDLRGDAGALADTLRRQVPNADKITHVYYFVFTSVGSDLEEEVAVNKKMLQNVIDGVSSLSQSLKFVVFPGGTRGYGIYVPGGTFTAPLTEDMVNNLPEDYAKTVAYPQFRNVLTEACRGKSWTWCEICPDAIIGFTPNGSQFSLALHWAQYLSLYAYNHGISPRAQGTDKGGDKAAVVEVPFPGVTAGYESLCSPVSASTIAQLAIYAGQHPDRCGDGRLFNIADADAPTKMRDLWPRLAAWFGLVGVGPEARSDTEPLPSEYVERYQGVFGEHGLDKAVKGGVGAGRKQLDSVGTWLTFDRQLSLDRLRAAGFEERRDPIEGWLKAFEKFREAGLIL
ncbi:Tannase and feruloyl esterase family protein [Apiospora arundinis]|uniref:Tannase and feruloyl esterase family protein n=1 Tax=Apiospora arundinis TaxID=335852 RepID=A0ABR2IRA9_9PEZI